MTGPRTKSVKYIVKMITNSTKICAYSIHMYINQLYNVTGCCVLCLVYTAELQGA